MKQIILALALALSIVSCKQNNKKETNTVETDQQDTEVVDGHSSEMALEWAGTYEGIFPCADCPGIKTTITLHDDKTYKLVQDYMDNQEPETESGSFQFDESGSIISLMREATAQKYKLVENAIIALDADGNEVTGELADSYILTKK